VVLSGLVPIACATTPPRAAAVSPRSPAGQAAPTTPVALAPGATAMIAIDPRLPRRLVLGSGSAPEVLFVQSDASGVHLRRARPGAVPIDDLALLASEGQALRFDALRDSSGTYHIGLIVHARDHVRLVVARGDGAARLRVVEVFDAPSVGALDTHGDGLVARAPAEAYESVSVAASPGDVTQVAWTDGRSTKVARVDASGGVVTSEVPGAPARRVALGIGPRGERSILASGDRECPGRGFFCNDAVAFARESDGRWALVPVARGMMGAPALVAGRDGALLGLLGDGTTLVDPASPSRRRVVLADRTAPDAETYTWSTLVPSERGPWFVGVSRGGSLHAALAEPTARGPERGIAPVVDLESIPAGPESAPAAAVHGDDLFVLYGTPLGVHVRRVAIAPAAPVADPLAGIVDDTWELDERQVPLAQEPVFGETLRRNSVPACDVRLEEAHEPHCVVSLARVGPVDCRDVALAATGMLRVAHGTAAGVWRVDEYSRAPAVIAEPGVSIPPADGHTVTAYSAGCPARQYQTGEPRFLGSRAVSLGAGAWWVASLDDGAFAAVPGDGLVRVRWSGVAPSVEPTGPLGAAALARSVRVRLDAQGRVRYAYASERQDLVHIAGGAGARERAADAGAFGFALDAGGEALWVVRRAGSLVLERERGTALETRTLAPTDALPLAVRSGPDGTLVTALRTPVGSVVIAAFAPDGRRTLGVARTCLSGRAVVAAAFAGPLLVYACE
jgi:hypothetical protein